MLMQIEKNVPQWLAGLAYSSFFSLHMSLFAPLLYSSDFFQKSWAEEQSTNTTVQARGLHA